MEPEPQKPRDVFVKKEINDSVDSESQKLKDKPKGRIAVIMDEFLNKKPGLPFVNKAGDDKTLKSTKKEVEDNKQNKYSIFCKYAEHVAFGVFLIFWLLATVTFLGSITAA